MTKIMLVTGGRDRGGDLGRLGKLTPKSARDIEWAVDRSTRLLTFENGVADWEAAASVESKAAVVVSRYSPEVYGLDASPPHIVNTLVRLRRAEVDAGLRHVRFHPIDRSDDVLLIYEEGLVCIMRCRHVLWHQTHGRYDLKFVSTDDSAAHFEDQDGTSVIFSLSDGRRVA